MSEAQLDGRRNNGKVHHEGMLTPGDVRRYAGGEVTEIRKGISAMCRKLTPELVVKLYEMALDDDNQNQFRAIKEIIDRGYGRSPQFVELTVNSDDILSLSTHEIKMRLAAILVQGTTASPCDLIEGTVVNG